MLQSLWCLLLLLSSALVICHGIRIVPSSLTRGTETTTNPIEQDRVNEQHRRLKNVNVDVPTNPKDHLVTSLPLLADGALATKHYAGHLPASPNKDKYFFYWLFEPDLTQYPDTPDGDIPLLIWLNGGPGCSSMDGLFLENGPLRLEVVNGEWTLQVHLHSWHRAPAYVLYIDQPVGTGLSFTTSGKYPENDEQVNQDFHYFLQEFLKLHHGVFLNGKQNRLKRPLYFSGESHAGHYIPSVMAYILQQNNKGNSDTIVMPLSGAAIGNGWIDPVYQYAAAGAAYGYGIVDLAQKAALDQAEETCRQDLRRGKYTSSTCYSLLDRVVYQSEGGTSNIKVSQYDARQREDKHKPRSFPPGHKDVESYLGGHRTQPDKPKMDSKLTQQVLQAIHATAASDAGQVYEECTDPPFEALSHQDGLGVVPDVVTVLQDPSSIRLLFFNGVWDLICNHVGNELTLQNLPWNKRDDWIKAERYAWVSSGSKNDMASGYVKEYDNLMFLKVMDSGHMVPMDVPMVAFSMIQTFLYNESFEMNRQQLDRSTKQDVVCPVCPTVNQSCAESSNALSNNSGENNNDGNAAMKFVVRHSWLGALLAVVAFLFVFLRRRYDAVPVVYNTEDEGMELKEQPHYRDDPNRTSFHDDDELDDEEQDASRTNGHII